MEFCDGIISVSISNESCHEFYALAMEAFLLKLATEFAADIFRHL